MIILVGTFPREDRQHELHIDTLDICREGGLTAKVRRIRDLTGTDYAVICRKGGKVWKRVYDTVDNM
jgi:hypothetical protein